MVWVFSYDVYEKYLNSNEVSTCTPQYAVIGETVLGTVELMKMCVLNVILITLGDTRAICDVNRTIDYRKGQGERYATFVTI